MEGWYSQSVGNIAPYVFDTTFYFNCNVVNSAMHADNVVPQGLAIVFHLLSLRALSQAREPHGLYTDVAQNFR